MSLRVLPGLLRLFAAVGIRGEVIEAVRYAPFGHLLVFAVGGDVRAAAYVVIEPGDAPRARLELLVVDPALATRASIEERLIGVVTALSVAYGCATLDIAATGRS